MLETAFQFRAKQADVIEAVLQSSDCCVLWPTGSGKSICYQLPALHMKKTVLIVSPLISLMTDQVFLRLAFLTVAVDAYCILCTSGEAFDQ